MDFLLKTYDLRVENNLYPFVFLNVDGNLFIFANNRSILFDHTKNRVVKTYPDIPGGDPRCYPSTGSAVLLPLKNLEARWVEAEVLVCGGAPRGSFEMAKQGKFLSALNTCGRIKVTDPNPQWVMETMPQGRVMSDMVMLPNGNVLIINGATMGTAGWEYGRSPILNPFIYKTDSPIGSRFEVQNPSEIPRMYHSTAVLLSDGRVLVGGSNPHIYYNFTDVLFPTELRLEAFSPSYLSSNVRPRILAPPSQTKLSYARSLNVRFQARGRVVVRGLVSVTMLAPPFNTHSFSMNQRLLVLDNNSNQLTKLENSTYEIEVMTPRSDVLAPPGFYLVFVVHQEIPSEGIWVQIQ